MISASTSTRPSPASAPRTSCPPETQFQKSASNPIIFYSSVKRIKCPDFLWTTNIPMKFRTWSSQFTEHGIFNPSDMIQRIDSFIGLITDRRRRQSITSASDARTITELCSIGFSTDQISDRMIWRWIRTPDFCTGAVSRQMASM